MGALASRLQRKKILSNATTERITPAFEKSARKRTKKAEKKGLPHLEITEDGYIHLVRPSEKKAGPKDPRTKPTANGKPMAGKSGQEKGKDRSISVAKTVEENHINLDGSEPDDETFVDGPIVDPFETQRDSDLEAAKLFKILSVEEIKQRQQQLVARVADVLGIPLSKAAVLLVCFRWNLEDLVELYRNDPEKVCKDAGVLIEGCVQIRDANDPTTEAERLRRRITHQHQQQPPPSSTPPGPTLPATVVTMDSNTPVRAHTREPSDVSAVANSYSYNADASNTGSSAAGTPRFDGQPRGGSSPFDRPPTPRRWSGNRIHLQPVQQATNTPWTETPTVSEDALLRLGIDLQTFNQRLTVLQDIIAVSDQSHAIELLLGAGGDLNIATNHYFTNPLPPPPPVERAPIPGPRSRSSSQRRRDVDLEDEIERLLRDLEVRQNRLRQEMASRNGNAPLHPFPHQTSRSSGDPSAGEANAPSEATLPANLNPPLRRAARRQMVLNRLNSTEQAAGLAPSTADAAPATDSSSSDRSRAPSATALLIEPITAAPSAASRPERIQIGRQRSATAEHLPHSDGHPRAIPAPALSIEPIAATVSSTSGTERRIQIGRQRASAAEVLSLEPIIEAAQPSPRKKPPPKAAVDDAAAHPGEALCQVCYCWSKSEELHALECGHAYCADCWAGHLMAKLSEGAVCLYAKCMAPRCGLTVPPDVWQRLLKPEGVARYEAFFARSFVNQQNATCWCPNPKSCDQAIMCFGERRSRALARCRCGYTFCWNCREEQHVPITCEQLTAWLQKCNRERANGVGEWIITNAKPCPSCKAPIEKNEGCMHMTCLVCCHEFCWLCRAAWSTHGEQTGGYYACNRYATSAAKAEDDDHENMKAELRRFLHYYERYQQHHRSREIATKLADAAPAKLREYHARNKESHFMHNFFLDAAKLVEDNTYAFAFFLPPEASAEKNLFEYLQANLEATTEKLTELTETPLERINVEQLVNYSKATKKFLDNLLDGLQHGLTYNQPQQLPPPSQKKSDGKEKRRLQDG